MTEAVTVFAGVDEGAVADVATDNRSRVRLTSREA